MNRKFKKCFITGITGSGGGYLCETILKKDKNIKIFQIFQRSREIPKLRQKIENVFIFDFDNF